MRLICSKGVTALAALYVNYEDEKMANTANPTVTLPGSGMTVRVRRQPGDMLRLIEASVRREFDKEKPVPPVQRMETGPGEFKDIEDENNPVYVAELEIFEQKVQTRFAEKMLEVIVRAGIMDNPEEDEMTELRELYTNLDIEIPADDRTFWVQFVIAPSAEDFAHLTYEIFGKSLPTEVQVAFHRQLFPSKVETPSS